MPPSQPAVAERRATGRALIHVGQQRPVDVGQQQIDPVDLERAQRPGGGRRARPGPPSAIPRPVAAVGGSAPPACTSGSSKAAAGASAAIGSAAPRLSARHDALDLEAGQIGGVLVQRLLDRELERRPRSGAAVAAALERQPRDAVLDAAQHDVAAVGLHVRAHRVQCLDHPLSERDRIQVVDQQQAGHRPVLGELVEDRRAGLARAPDRVHDPRQAVAVHRDHGSDELLCERPCPRICELVDPIGQVLDPVEQLGARRARLRRLHSRQLNPVGVWITLRTRPDPAYMCTPHGRHGSKLRTARMMSMPLKLSGPFSSKIGVFCTASS